jgi:pantetheine-phosphate adenylyltransferase
VKAICPGSFDPVTSGHLDVFQRAARLFDEVVVAVGRNSAKNYLFDTDERVAMIEAATADLPTLTVKPLSGLLVDFCAAEGAGVIVKGVRTGTDFDFETQMANMNRAQTGVETVLLASAPQWSHVSSTMVREIASLGGDVAQFVGDEVARRVRQRVQERRAST